METSKFPFDDTSSSSSSSSAFSECNSDRSCEFLWLSCASGDHSAADDLIRHLISGLLSPSIEHQRQSAMEFRLLAKNKPENRIKIARSGALAPLISLISSPDLQIQEYGVTAILNLSLCDDNKDLIVDCGAIKPLVLALRIGTDVAKENAACTLLRLSQADTTKIAIGRSGAIPLLVDLLEKGGTRAKKDASTALYSLCSAKENRMRAVKAGIVRPLVELMADLGSEMVDKAAYVLSLLVSVEEARQAVVEEGGIAVVVEMVEVGSQRQREVGVGILLQVCEGCVLYRKMAVREGAVPALVALTESGTACAQKKVRNWPISVTRVLDFYWSGSLLLLLLTGGDVDRASKILSNVKAPRLVEHSGEWGFARCATF